MEDINQIPYYIVPKKEYNKETINDRFSKYRQYSRNSIEHNSPVATATNPAGMWNVAPTLSNLEQFPFIDKKYSNQNMSVNNVQKALNNYYKHNSKTSHNHPWQSSVNSHCNKQYYLRKNKYHMRQKNQGVSLTNNKNKLDLRLLLSLKRRVNIINKKEAQQRAFEVVTQMCDEYNVHNQGSIHSHPLRIRKKSYSFNPEDDDDNGIHRNIKQSDFYPIPCSSRRQSYNLNPNEEEDEDDNNLNNTHREIKQKGFNPVPSLRLNLQKKEEYDDHDDELRQSNQEQEVDIDPMPSCSLNYCFNPNAEDDDDDDNIDVNKFYEQKRLNPLSSSGRRTSCSFSHKDVYDNHKKDVKGSNFNHGETNQGDINQLPPYSRSSGCNQNGKEKDTDDNDNNKWLKINVKQREDTKPLNIETLRSALQVPENVDVWYLISDTNLLINNMHVISNILDADEQCCLMVPQTVMSKVESATKSRFKLQAYKAVCFILQNAEENRAVIVENNEVGSTNDDILSCCIQVMDQGIHIVLLTDDIELHNNDNASNIPTFTVAEIKRLANEKETNEIYANDLKLAKTQNIKITIENESNIQYDNQSIISSSENNTKVKEYNPSNPLNTQIEKKACDIAVQADSATNDGSNEIILPDSTKTNDNESSNAAGVQLKRYLSRDLSPIMRNADNKKEWHGEKSTSSLAYGICKVSNSRTSMSPITDYTTNEYVFSDAGNFSWGLSSPTPLECLYKNNHQHNDMCSESSSLVLRKASSQYNTIEDNSNSIISNTASTADTGSETNGHQAVGKEEGTANDSNVMFEVSDARMEEFLRRNSDEWVSRLVQVMEEALSQVLRLQPAAELEHLPPPWTLYEAAECIKKRFHYDSDVVDATNKFLRISFENGGLRGKIKSNICPHKFMELYSYAVYLIDALQGVLCENVDLQTAAESLSLLLSNIQDPHFEQGNQDSFGDMSMRNQEANIADDIVSENMKEIDSTVDDSRNKLQESPKRTKKNKTPVSSPEKYNLRSFTKKPKEVPEDTADNVTLPRTIDSESNFFSSLYLKKNLTNNAESEREKSNLIIEFTSNDNDKQGKAKTKHIPGLNHTDGQVESTSEEIVAMQNFNDEPKVSEPKIVRQFTKCLEFENKLIGKTRLFYDACLLDSEMFTESVNTDRNDFTQDCEIGDMDDTYAVDFSDDIWQRQEYTPEDTVNSSLQSAECQKITVSFKKLVEKLERDVQRAYSSIQNFCVKSCESLQSEDTSSEDISQIQIRAEKTSSYIQQICDQLNSVLRKNISGDDSIFKILRDKSFHDITVEDNDMKIYGNFIENCLEQGITLKESVELVRLLASNSQGV